MIDNIKKTIKEIQDIVADNEDETFDERMDVLGEAFDNNIMGMNVYRLIESYIENDKAEEMDGFDFNKQLKKQIAFDEKD